LRNPHSRQILAPAIHVQPLESQPPAWVAALIPDPGDGDGINVAARGSLLRARTRLRNARFMDADTLSAAVHAAYMSLAKRIADAGLYPIRIWNFVPGIGDRFGDLDRYMVFNRGRFEALAQIGTPSLATSSAVGVDSNDLTIDMLGAPEAGTQVENPRQISSWMYSACHGPRPPCFARGTIATLDGTPWLLIGGTASIVGEDSCHEGNVEAQLDETLANLCAVIESVTPRCADPLSLLDDVRVYIARADDADGIADGVRRRIGCARAIEMALATVCRPELLVEIEGRVCLTPRPA
jgi:chorismate lyase/3-hydroxybenzoate synthase